MKYIEHMKVLTRYFNKKEEVETTIARLAEILSCSERHVKTIVNFLHQAGYVEWRIQRGRGKKPKLMLNYTHEEVHLKEAKQSVKMEKYQAAFFIVSQLEKEAQYTFQEWFRGYLGMTHKNIEDNDLDILRYPFYETKLSMDPLLIISRHDAHMVQQVFERLVEFNRHTGQLVPKIARHFESRDGKRWVFYLHKGVLFHHGRELTSEDVSATLERFLKEDNIKGNVIRMECVTRYSIVFQLKHADYIFPRYLSSLKASIIPIEVFKKDEEGFQNLPVGSGPFQLIRNDNEMIRLDVFQQYYGLRPWLDRVEVINTPALFQDDQSHPFRLTAPDTAWKEVRSIEEGADYITFNCRKSGPLQDSEFRRRICQIIDPEQFCLEGEMVAHSFLTQKSRELDLPVRSNAKQKLAGNVELKIAAQQIREGVNHEREAMILKQQLEQAGIEAEVEIVNAIQFKDPQVIEKYDLFVSGIALSDDRLLSVLTSIHSNQLSIFPCLDEDMKVFINKQVSKMKTFQDETARWNSYFEIEDYLKAQHAIIFLNHRIHTIYESESSQYANIELDSHGRVDYRAVWKK